MSITSIAPVTEILLAEARELSRLTRAAVTIWQQRPAWTAIETVADESVPQTLASDTAQLWLLDDAPLRLITQAAAGSPALQRCADRTTWIATPLGTESPAEYVALVQTTVPIEQLVGQLLTQSRDEHKHALTQEYQAEQLELYASQVTADFEELTWLRELAAQVNCCTVDADLDALAESTLPMLRDLLHCRSINLVLTHKANPEHAADCRFLAWGDPPAEDLSWEIIDRYRERASWQPTILNVKSISPELRNLPNGVQTALLVPVTRQQQLFGWLLAIDKQISLDVRSHLNDAMHPDSFREFGTSEASLLQSAATLFATHAKNLQLFGQQRQLLTGVVKALINALDARDPYTCGHSDRVARYSRIIAQRMGIAAEECQRIYLAGLVHDIGKVGIPDDILGKPGRLTDDEFAVIKQHPEVGYHILKHLQQFDYVLPGVLHHHEAWNGKGYPHQLAGEQIPLMARILAVADTFDALTSNRPYRDGMPLRKAISILNEGADSQWDARCVNALLDRMDEVITIMEETDVLTKQTLKFIDPKSERIAEVDSVETAVMTTSRI